MRLLAALSLAGLLAGCSGDSSAVMSVWNDGGSAGAGGARGQGGQGPATTAGVGGAGGAVVPTGGIAGSAGVVVVPGGSRDVVTTQCTTTSSGGGCPADLAFLQCLTGPCGKSLAACYQGDSVAPTGLCGPFAACMLTCPCDGGRSTCEAACLQNKGFGDADCSPCLGDLYSCWSKNGCAPPVCASAGNSVTAGP